jgi:negative regulator of sigma E activity
MWMNQVEGVTDCGLSDVVRADHEAEPARKTALKLSVSRSPESPHEKTAEMHRPSDSVIDTASAYRNDVGPFRATAQVDVIVVWLTQSVTARSPASRAVAQRASQAPPWSCTPKPQHAANRDRRQPTADSEFHSCDAPIRYAIHYRSVARIDRIVAQSNFLSRSNKISQTNLSLTGHLRRDQRDHGRAQGRAGPMNEATTQPSASTSARRGRQRRRQTGWGHRELPARPGPKAHVAEPWVN